VTAAPYRLEADGLRLAVRLTPKARDERLEGVVSQADGQTLLKIAVTAPPEDGKANAALEALLAKALKLPKSAVAVVGGATHRRKLVKLTGDGPAIAARLETLLAG
jgi:uncharacterized protein (TIGR00251 family)